MNSIHCFIAIAMTIQLSSAAQLQEPGVKFIALQFDNIEGVPESTESMETSVRAYIDAARPALKQICNKPIVVSRTVEDGETTIKTYTSTGLLLAEKVPNQYDAPKKEYWSLYLLPTGELLMVIRLPDNPGVSYFSVDGEFLFGNVIARVVTPSYVAIAVSLENHIHNITPVLDSTIVAERLINAMFDEIPERQTIINRMHRDFYKHLKSIAGTDGATVFRGSSICWQQDNCPPHHTREDLYAARRGFLSEWIKTLSEHLATSTTQNALRMEEGEIRCFKKDGCHDFMRKKRKDEH